MGLELIKRAQICQKHVNFSNGIAAGNGHGIVGMVLVFDSKYNQS